MSKIKACHHMMVPKLNHTLVFFLLALLSVGAGGTHADQAFFIKTAIQSQQNGKWDQVIVVKMKLQNGTIMSVHKTLRGNRPHTGNPSYSPHPEAKPCGKCGMKHAYGKCKAKNLTCLACNEVGHFIKVCLTKNKGNTSEHSGLKSVTT